MFSCRHRGADNRLRRRDGAHSWPPLERPSLGRVPGGRESPEWGTTWRRPIGRRSRTRLGRLGQRPSTTTVHLFGATHKRMFDVRSSAYRFTLSRARRHAIGSTAIPGMSRQGHVPETLPLSRWLTHLSHDRNGQRRRPPSTSRRRSRAGGQLLALPGASDAQVAPAGRRCRPVRRVRLRARQPLPRS